MCAAAILFCSLSQAQISVTTYGQTIENNEVFTFNVAGTGAELPFNVSNDGDSDVYMRIRLDEMTNSTGANFQFCFGEVCLFSVAEGSIVPPPQTYPPLEIESGGITSAGSHMWNSNTGDGTSVMTFKFVFEQYDANDVYLNDVLTMYYVYNPQLSVETFQQLNKVGIANVNTLVESQLDIDATGASTMEILGLNGQVLRNQKLVAGHQSVDVSDLASSMYVLRFTNSDNKSAQVKIIKK